MFILLYLPPESHRQNSYIITLNGLQIVCKEISKVTIMILLVNTSTGGWIVNLGMVYYPDCHQDGCQNQISTGQCVSCTTSKDYISFFHYDLKDVEETWGTLLKNGETLCIV